MENKVTLPLAVTASNFWGNGVISTCCRLSILTIVMFKKSSMAESRNILVGCYSHGISKYISDIV